MLPVQQISNAELTRPSKPLTTWQRVQGLPRQVMRRAVRGFTSLVRRAGAPALDIFDIGDRLTMGRYTYGRPRVRWYYGDDGRVRIGSFCSIADDVIMTIGGEHPSGWPSTYPFRIQLGLPGAYEDGLPGTKGDIEIGNDVWIGRGARILSGVMIGDGAIIGAYAVVSKDVRPYAIVVGNPAREIRRRFADSQVVALREIAWWAWPEEKILANIEFLNQGNIDTFIERFGKDV
jgi:acetyltransferase-like isoleucine patch superfamily enzyme